MGVVLAFDLWHQVLFHHSFLLTYITHQLKYTIVDARGAISNDLTFYLKELKRYWPWLPLVLGSFPLMLYLTQDKKNQALPAFMAGALLLCGSCLGFTLIAHKSPWFINIHFVGSSLLAGIVAMHLIPHPWIEKGYVKITHSLGIVLLFLSGCFSSLFTNYPRPFEDFMTQALTHLKSNLEDKSLANCISIDPWKGPFFFAFYLGARPTNCSDPTAYGQLVHIKEIPQNAEIMFASTHYAIVRPHPRTESVF